jgi:hypothetical protein
MGEGGLVPYYERFLGLCDCAVRAQHRTPRVTIWSDLKEHL